MSQIWCAYYSDWSSCVIFDNELECLRYAISNSMQVKLAELGKELRSE